MTNQTNFVNDAISDTEVIARILHGEKDLYAILVRKYNQRLYRVGMSIINDDAEIEDAMQVAYINAYENLGKFEFKASFSTWLTRILINECLLRLRKRKQSLIMNDNRFESEMYQKPAGNLQTPLTKMLNSELKTALEQAIQKLPEKYRSVFILRELENMNVTDTKECLAISEANVKVRFNRAKALLREYLNGFFKKEDILHFHLFRCDRVTENVMKHIGKL